jgi:hypothetical protein
MDRSNWERLKRIASGGDDRLALQSGQGANAANDGQT